MYTRLSNSVKLLLNKSDKRTNQIVKNIILSFGVKGGSIIVGLLLVPLTISYVNPVYYGIWLTISSITNWMGFFDIGLSHGLRLQITTSVASDNYEEAKIYVSTSYAVLAIISSILLIIFAIGNNYVDWNGFFNIPPTVTESIRSVILIILFSFCLQFVVQIINSILLAFHKPANSSFIYLIGQLCVLTTTFIATKTIPGTLHVLVWIITCIPIVVLIIASIVLFNTSLKQIAPSIKAINFKYAKKIFNVGVSFFVIQIGAIVLFQTDNIIVTKVMGPQYVTEFNVGYKLFAVITMIFTVIIIPYWSAFTDAFVKKDYAWMKANIFKIRMIWLGLTACTVVLYFISPFLFKLWVGNKVSVSTTFSFFTALYVITTMWQTGHVYFLNGLGKIRVQLILVVISAAINVPLALFLGRKFGLSGVVSANTVVFLIMSIVYTIQTQKILNRTAKGIWFK